MESDDAKRLLNLLLSLRTIADEVQAALNNITELIKAVEKQYWDMIK